MGTATPAGNGAYTASGAGFTPSVAGNYWWYSVVTVERQQQRGGQPVQQRQHARDGVAPATKTLTFSSAGTYAVTVPAGVTSFTYTLEGAGGGGGGGYSGSHAGGTGGAGGKVTGTITLASNPSGTVLDLVVGSAGTGGSGNGTGTGGTGGTGGSAAGGNGGTSSSSGGGGGGGASEIYVTSSTPIVLAGGGAGGGALANSTAGNGTGSGGAGPIGNGAAGTGSSNNGGGGGGGGFPTVPADLPGAVGRQPATEPGARVTSPVRAGTPCRVLRRPVAVADLAELAAPAAAATTAGPVVAGTPNWLVPGQPSSRRSPLLTTAPCR